ncbi:hypothetical protein [Streptomyces phaeochromogenes]
MNDDWTMLKFGEIAQNLTQRVDSPERAGVDRYVGLEHIESGVLTVNRWADPSAVSATKLRFQTGDVILGRRRIYQRKAAVANFEGICSAHALVLRANADVALPKFLPVFLQSDRFINCGVRISVGSLSPTVNWRTLAGQSFLMPPLDEQRRIADLVWAFENTAQAKSVALETARQAELSALVELYDRPEWPVRKVKEAGEVQLGLKREPKVHSGDHPRPYLRVANVGDDELFLGDVLEMNFDEGAFAKYQLRCGDILLNEGQSLEYVGRSAMYREEIDNCCFQMTLLRFRSGNDVLPEFAHGWFRRCLHMGHFARVAKRTTSMAHLPAGLLSVQPIPVPSKSEQKRVVERLGAARELRQTLERGLKETRTLMSRTLNTVLSG